MKWPWMSEKRSAPDPSWSALVPSATTGTGAHVTAHEAEGLSAVFACVQTIAETVAGLPLILYRRTTDGGRERAPEMSLYTVLHSQPNAWQTALEFREQMQASVLLRGNAYAKIRFDGGGNVVALEPLMTDRVTVLKLGNGRIAYDYHDDSGRARRLLADEVLHLKDRTEDGIVGRSRIRVARETLGLALAQQEHGARTFANGTRLSGVLETPHQMTEPALERIGKSWREQFSGTANVGKTAILENGLTYKAVSMSLEDAEWIAASQFSVEQVCRIFRVPPTMVGDLRHGNYSNSVEMGRVFVTHTLRRHLIMWEQGIERVLLSPAARERYFAEHNVEGLLRGDSVNRSTFYESGIRAGWLLPSEARRLENLPMVEGLDDAVRLQTAPAA